MQELARFFVVPITNYQPHASTNVFSNVAWRACVGIQSKVIFLKNNLLSFDGQLSLERPKESSNSVGFGRKQCPTVLKTPKRTDFDAFIMRRNDSIHKVRLNDVSWLFISVI